jgi:DNA phosphorothioation-dependent restriction protein DptG
MRQGETQWYEIIEDTLANADTTDNTEVLTTFATEIFGCKRATLVSEGQKLVSNYLTETIITI